MNKRKRKPKLTRELILRAWTLGSAKGSLDTWMNDFIDELAKLLEVEIK